MNIGNAASASGISAKMIRYYERVGLILPAQRTDAGYRVYSQSDVHTLAFVRRARDVGFSVDQMRELLALWQDRERSSSDVKRLALGHVEELEHKIVTLERMRDRLKYLATNCHGDDRPDCPIIGDFSGVDAE